jgi:hypothetical protein
MTTLILLDRSASMEAQDLQTGESKRMAALHKLSQLLDTLGSTSRLVLIESTQPQAHEIDSAGSLLDLLRTTATATSADIPAMLQSALEYVTENTSGRTDIWICSDLRDHDWQPDDGRWAAVREGFSQLPGIRFYLLSYSEAARENLSVSVANLRQRAAGASAELVMDVHVRREGGTASLREVPLELVINGARSALQLTITGSEHVLQGHTVALDRNTSRGWGRVALPPDSNPQDNVFYFVFSPPPVHRTVIVSDDPRAAVPMQLAAASPPDPSVSYTATVLSTDRVAELDWDAASLILWHAPLPDGLVADQVQEFVASGRPILLFPSADDRGEELFGVKWGEWNGDSQQPVNVASWRGESDLLAHTPSGAVLPLGKAAHVPSSVDPRAGDGAGAAGRRAAFVGARGGRGTGLSLCHAAACRLLQPGPRRSRLLCDDPAGVGHGCRGPERRAATGGRFARGPGGRFLGGPFRCRCDPVGPVAPGRRVSEARTADRLEPSAGRGQPPRAG